MDAHGDLIATYHGNGPDVSETDVDQTIENQLLPYYTEYAAENAAGKVTGLDEYRLTAAQTQIGLESQQLESYYGLLHGESNGILYSEFDSLSPGTLTPLYSDSIATAQRQTGTMQATSLQFPRTRRPAASHWHCPRRTMWPRLSRSSNHPGILRERRDC